MLTKKKWYITWKNYAKLLREKECDGEFFLKDKELEDVKEKLNQYCDTMAHRLHHEFVACAKLRLPSLYTLEQLLVFMERILWLQQVTDTWEMVTEADYEETYFPYFPQLARDYIIGAVVATLF